MKIDRFDFDAFDLQEIKREGQSFYILTIFVILTFADNIVIYLSL